jgi:hypothetical protein
MPMIQTDLQSESTIGAERPVVEDEDDDEYEDD